MAFRGSRTRSNKMYDGAGKCRPVVWPTRYGTLVEFSTAHGSLQSAFLSPEIVRQFQKRQPGEVSVRCLSRLQRNTLRVDDETDGFCELLQAEHIRMTALTRRER